MSIVCFLATFVCLLFCVNRHNAAENLKSYDPIMYHVNNIEDLDKDVIHAYITKNTSLIAKLSSIGKQKFDIFICINENYHASVLSVPVGNDEKVIYPDVIKDDPLFIPEQNLCWTYELCFQNVQLKTYKIRKQFGTFKGIQHFTKVFYIGRYKGASPNALQFAALGASPHRYNVLLSDCVEFAKEFCICLLKYTDNGKELEKNVVKRIHEATATGLSVEELSRNIRLSGWLGNSLLNAYLGSILLTDGEIDLFTIIKYIAFFLYPLLVMYCLRRRC